MSSSLALRCCREGFRMPARDDGATHSGLAWANLRISGQYDNARIDATIQEMLESNKRAVSPDFSRCLIEWCGGLNSAAPEPLPVIWA
jgi:hypothetical protein